MQFVQTKFHCVVYRGYLYFVVLHRHNISYKKKPSKQTNKQKKQKKKKKKEKKKERKTKKENAKIFLRSGQRELKRQRIEALGESTPCVEKFRILVERAFRRSRGYADASAAPRINKLCRVSAYPVGVTPYVENQYPIHIRVLRILAEVRFSTCLALSPFYRDAICSILARAWETQSYSRICSDFRR